MNTNKYSDSSINSVRLINTEGYSFGMTMVDGKPAFVPVVYDSTIMDYVTQGQPVFKTDTLNAVVDFPDSQKINADSLPLPSGAATSANQDSQLISQATLESLILTIQELVARLSVLSSWASSGAPGMRVVGVSMPSTAVTGPLTSAQHLANELTQRMATENMAAVLSNVNNCVGK